MPCRDRGPERTAPRDRAGGQFNPTTRPDRPQCDFREARVTCRWPTLNAVCAATRIRQCPRSSPSNRCCTPGAFGGGSRSTSVPTTRGFLFGLADCGAPVSLDPLGLMSPRHVALAALIGFTSPFVLLFGAGEVLSRPAVRPVGAPPPDLPALGVRLHTASGASVIGWFARGQPGKGAVLLLHGVRADRTQMLRRARFLNQAGYAALLVDLPAHGESSGDRITFGAREAAGVTAALEYLRHELPGEHVGVIGVSLGAASTVLAEPKPAPDAVILESMYPTIEEAVADRLVMRLGPLGASLVPPLLWQLSLRTGVHAQDLRPIQHLPRLGAPVLIVSGTEDKHTTWARTQRLFDSAVEPKELWRVEGATHVDLHAFRPEEYERRILRFLAKHLRNGA